MKEQTGYEHDGELETLTMYASRVRAGDYRLAAEASGAVFSIEASSSRDGTENGYGKIPRGQVVFQVKFVDNAQEQTFFRELQRIREEMKSIR